MAAQRTPDYFGSGGYSLSGANSVLRTNAGCAKLYGMAVTTIPEWTLADRIRKARTAAGLKQSDVAEACGVYVSTVSDWEKENTRPKPYYVKQIALRCNVPVEWLVGEDAVTEGAAVTVGYSRSWPATSFALAA